MSRIGSIVAQRATRAAADALAAQTRLGRAPGTRGMLMAGSGVNVEGAMNVLLPSPQVSMGSPVLLQRRFVHTRKNPKLRSFKRDGRGDRAKANKRITEFGTTKKWNDLLAMYNFEGRIFDHINLANMGKQLTKCRVADFEAIKTDARFHNFVTNVTTKHVGFWDPATFATVLTALSHLQIQDDRIAEAVVTQAEWLLYSGEPKDIVSVCSSTASLNMQGTDPFYKEIGLKADWFINNASDSEIDTICDSASQLNIQDAGIHVLYTYRNGVSEEAE